MHGEVGYNFRLTNLQAALGVSQLELLPEFLETKRRHYDSYRAALNGVAGLRIADVPPYAENNCWMVPLQINASVYGRDRDAVMADLAQRKIQSRPLWQLNHLQAPYKGCRAWDILRAPLLLEATVNLPCSVGLTPDDLATVVARPRRDEGYRQAAPAARGGHRMPPGPPPLDFTTAGSRNRHGSP